MLGPKIFAETVRDSGCMEYNRVFIQLRDKVDALDVAHAETLRRVECLETGIIALEEKLLARIQDVEDEMRQKAETTVTDVHDSMLTTARAAMNSLQGEVRSEVKALLAAHKREVLYAGRLQTKQVNTETSE